MKKVMNAVLVTVVFVAGLIVVGCPDEAITINWFGPWCLALLVSYAALKLLVALNKEDEKRRTEK